MPLVTANPRGQQDGSTRTQFTDTTNTSLVTYTYPTAQSSLIIENSGERDIFVTVGTVSNQVIQVDKKWRYDGSFTSFSIRSDVNSQEFIATAIYQVTTDFAVITTQLADIATFNNYSTVLTKDANGNITKVELKDGSTVIQTTNITRDSNGNVTSIADIANEKTVTTTVNRASDGTVSSVSKAVV